MNSQRNILLVIVVLLIAGSIWYLQSTKVAPGSGGENSDVKVLDVDDKADRYEAAKEITTPDGFINTEDISIEELIGKKVILIDFWTYSCINCQRTTPFLNAWYEKYKDSGLEIIGIHTPEFAFEREYDNVKAAVEEFGIKFPVVLDNDYSTWRAYNNRYWPRKYLIDIDGYIVYDHIGEGGYDETEANIQAALAERIQRLGLDETFDPDMVNVEEVKSEALSPEIYFGSDRNDYLINGEAGKAGVQSMSLQRSPELDELVMTGRWDIQPESAKNLETGSKIIFHFAAKNVFMVAGANRNVPLKITLDGQDISRDIAGDDVTADGIVNVNSERLYKLIQSDEVIERTLEIEVLDEGLEAFTFTFG